MQIGGESSTIHCDGYPIKTNLNQVEKKEKMLMKLMMTKESGKNKYSRTFECAERQSPSCLVQIALFFPRYSRQLRYSFGRWCATAFVRDSKRPSTGWRREATATVSTKAVCPFTPTTPPSRRSIWTLKPAPTHLVTTQVTQ